MYILEINPLSVAAFANIFSLLVFYFVFVSFGVQKLLSIIKFPLFIFIFQYSKTWIKKDSSVVYVRVLFFFLAVPCDLWDPSSLTGDRTQAHSSESAKS